MTHTASSAQTFVMEICFPASESGEDVQARKNEYRREHIAAGVDDEY